VNMQTTEEIEVFDDIPFVLDFDEFVSEIRADAYPELADEVNRYVNRAAAVARPRALLRVAYVGDRDGDAVEFGGQRFCSSVLAENLADIHRVFAYTASCGPEVYSLDISDLDPFASFWHDTFKIAVLQAATNYLKQEVTATYGISRFSNMNPGSGNVDVWPISQQRELFTVLGDTDGLIGVRLTDSFLMVPDKSVSGIFFPSERDYNNCQTCSRKICPNRSAPYRPG